MASSGDQSPTPAVTDRDALSTPGSLKSTKPDVALIVRKQPPSHVFSKEWFHVDFGLDVSKSQQQQQRTGVGDDMEFVISLWPLCDDSSHVLFVEPSSIWFGMRGTPPRRKHRVKCQLQPTGGSEADIATARSRTVGRDSATSYCLRLSPKNPQSGWSELEHVSTTPINVVNHKIRVETDSEWENVWYKDEGGRDKSMVVVASLHDRDGEILKGEQIPLQLGLFYNNEDSPPIKVMKQDILRTIGGAKPVIDETTGKATIRFRVEDVSKNHQGQDFKIEVAVPSKGFKDVAPGFSPAVNVRSKRNKRQRSSMPSGRPEANVGSPERRPSAYDEPSDGVFAASELPQLREALKGVIRWADEVVTGMVSLQWQVIGYHQHPDGSPDYNRPYHNIPNPDAVVSRIMGMYSETTREQLMTILHAIDRGSQDHYSSLIPPPRIPRGENDDDDDDDEGYAMVQQQRGGVPVQSSGGGRMGYLAPPPSAGIHHHHHPSMMMSSLREGGFHDKPEVHRPELLNNYPYHAMPRIPTMEGLHPHGIMRPHQPQPMHRDPMHHHHHQQQLQQQQQHHMAISRMVANPPIATGTAAAGQYHHTDTTTPASGVGSFRGESEVAFVLAKQFKSIRTGDGLGFPAYSRSKELLGFYRESGVGVAHFCPIHPVDFGPRETADAVHVLQEAIRNKSEAVHALKDWGSMSSLMDHVLVYDWSKGIGGGSGGGGHGAQSGSSTPSD